MIIYWFNVIENVGIVCIILAVVFILAAGLLFVPAVLDPPYDEEKVVTLRKRLKKNLFVGVGLIVLSIFIPSQRVLLQSYIVENIATFVEQNDKVKDLPDKVIECCDKLLNEYMANEQAHRE